MAKATLSMKIGLTRQMAEADGSQCIGCDKPVETHGYKLMLWQADTSGGVKELGLYNGLVCRECGHALFSERAKV